MPGKDTAALAVPTVPRPRVGRCHKGVVSEVLGQVVQRASHAGAVPRYGTAQDQDHLGPAGRGPVEECRQASGAQVVGGVDDQHVPPADLR